MPELWGKAGSRQRKVSDCQLSGCALLFRYHAAGMFTQCKEGGFTSPPAKHLQDLGETMFTGSTLGTIFGL